MIVGLSLKAPFGVVFRFIIFVGRDYPGESLMRTD